MIKNPQSIHDKSDLNRSFREEGKLRLNQVTKNLGPADAKEYELAACLSLVETPFSDVAPRAVLIGDSHKVPQFKTNQLYSELNERMQMVLPTLFMAQSSVALDRGATPGEKTLFNPLFPSLHRKALASAKLVVSFHLEPILVALANRVPAIFIAGQKTEQTEFASQIGVPVVVGQSPAKMVAEIEMYFAHYSWKKIDEFLSGLKSKYAFQLSAENTKTSNATNGRFTVCSISDSNYLPFFLGFLENVNLASGGNFRCYLLALDAKVFHQVKKLKLSSQIQILSLRDLWTEQELPIVLQRGLGNQAYSTKPRLILRALKETHGPVFYCDSDVYFCQSVSSLQKTLNENLDEVVLFPHLNDDFCAAQRDGLFNAGMLGVAPGAETFLDWWSSACLRECSIFGENGFTGDQGYLNLAPILFERVKIFKEHFHNVARWNSKTLKLGLNLSVSEQPVIENNLPVATYHAAFADDAGVYQLKYCWDQVVSFFSPGYLFGTSTALESNLLFQQRNLWKRLDYILKIEKWRRLRFINRLAGKSKKIYSEFWLTTQGISCLTLAIKTRQIFRTVQKLVFLRTPSTPVTAAKDSSVDGWVLSNHKALKIDPNSGDSAQKVA